VPDWLCSSPGGNGSGEGRPRKQSSYKSLESKEVKNEREAVPNSLAPASKKGNVIHDPYHGKREAYSTKLSLDGLPVSDSQPMAL
jgi:hypothetical protein